MEKESQPFKLCCNLNFMMRSDTTLEEKYCEASRLGFKGVETAAPYEVPAHDLEMCRKKYGLTQVLINTPIGVLAGGEFGQASLPGKEQKFMESLQIAISYAQTLNCNMIHIMAGLETAGNSNSAHTATYCANLKRAASELAHRGIVGVIEPINKYSVPNYFLNDFEKAIEIIKAVNSPNIRLLLDIYHLQLIKGNIWQSMMEYLPYTKHIQVAQVPGRHEPGSQGELDYRFIFSELKKYNYTGWIGLEYIPEQTAESGLKYLEACGVHL